MGHDEKTGEEICKAVHICDDEGNDPRWTDEVLYKKFSYMFCQSEKFGIIYKKTLKVQAKT